MPKFYAECLSAVLAEGKVILAFSSSMMLKDGSSKFNCPIWPKVDKYFVPFTDNEVQEFITNRNCPIKEYRERTTLPLIVEDVLIARKP